MNAQSFSGALGVIRGVPPEVKREVVLPGAAMERLRADQELMKDPRERHRVHMVFDIGSSGPDHPCARRHAAAALESAQWERDRAAQEEEEVAKAFGNKRALREELLDAREKLEIAEAALAAARAFAAAANDVANVRKQEEALDRYIEQAALAEAERTERAARTERAHRELNEAITRFRKATGHRGTLHFPGVSR